MTVARGENYLYVTWLSKLMAGEVNCLWSTWFKVHYKDFAKQPPSYELAVHVAQHSQLLAELTAERIELGEQTLKEAQGFFRVALSKTMVIGGKPDLVTIDAAGQGVVYDCKSGKQKHSDILQVMLYMLCLPYSVPAVKGKRLAGCVVYRTGERIPIPAEAIDDSFKQSARHFANLLDASIAPDRVPSAPECGFCDITIADCPERIATLPPHLAEVPALDWGVLSTA